MGYVGDGVLCAVDGDGDGYTDVDMSLFHYCQTQTENILCTTTVHMFTTLVKHQRYWMADI
jgi:hypothetical protein